MKHMFFLILMILSINTFAGQLWYCSAIGDKGAIWNQYGLTHAKTLSVVRKKCKEFDKHQTCNTVCFPPREYWRCFSHDSIPKDISATQPEVKPGAWLWSSYSKQIAINGAKEACRYNSAFGGCYVTPESCASS